MLDGEAYRAHFADDPAYQPASPVEAPGLANSAALLKALAAPMRNVDSKMHSLRYDCCAFLFYR
jgi:hypothetical protein